MKTRGFIQIPLLILIIVGIIILGGGGYLGIIQYENYQSEKSEREKESRELLTAQQKALSEATSEIEKLKQKNDETRSKQFSLEKKLDDRNTSEDLPSIIKEWRPRVVLIVCDQIQWGSGTLIKFNDSDYIDVVTNKHVVKINNNLPNNCYIYLPFKESGTGYKLSVWGSNIEESLKYDWATIPLKLPNEYTKSTAPTEDYICKEKALIGDKIIILGYPAIGSSEDITVTEGIISGYDEEFYITSAKVEQGNSGGATILLKDNCYLGIPTLAITGLVESLARILDARIILGLSTTISNVNLSPKKGTITVFNNYSSANQRLIKSTRFMAQNGLIYRIQTGTIIPGYGSIEVEIVSDGNGKEYELNCSTTNPCTFKIPGFEGGPRYDKFYGKGFTPIK